MRRISLIVLLLAAPAAAQTPPGSIPACDYITIDEAKLLLGDDVTAMTAPSKGLFTSCGYTSVHGEALTLYISDYGLPTVAEQFFEKTRESLKTATKDDTLGVPAWSNAQPGPPPVLTMSVLKDQRIVKVEATGPIVGLSTQIPRLRAIVQRVLSTIDAPADANKPADAKKP